MMKDYFDMAMNHEQYFNFVIKIASKIPWYIDAIIIMFVSLSILGKIYRTQAFFHFYIEKNVPNIEQSKEIGFDNLGGKIIYAKSFINYKPRNEFLFVVKESEDSYDIRPYLLQRIGNIYNENQKIFNNEKNYGFVDYESIGVTDIDGSGNKYIHYIRRSQGNMAGMDELILVSTISPFKRFEITKSYDSNFQNVPTKFHYEFPDNISGHTEESIKKFARSINFIDDTPIKANPVVEWSAENEDVFESSLGQVKLKLKKYSIEKFKINESSIESELENESIKITSFFKGEVIAFDKKRREYFVLFASPNRYDWVSDMHFENNRLWLSVRFKGAVLILFDDDFKKAVIHRVRIANQNIKDADSIQFSKNGLVFEDTEYRYDSILKHMKLK